MPKPKPDQVIRHEIVLGRSERDMLEPFFASMMARNVSKAWFNVTSDMTTVVVTVIAYEFLTNKDTGILEAVALGGSDIWSWMVDGWIAHKTSPAYAERYEERAHSVGGGLINFFDNLFGGMYARGSENLERQFGQS